MTDNEIMLKIFQDPDKYNARELVDLIKSHDTILIGDRGFERFKEWIETNDEFQSVKVKLPVNKVIDKKLKQYTRHDVDESRTYVTAIRYIVEQIHGAQKQWKLLASEFTIRWGERHFLEIHMIINGFLNAFGINKRTLGKTRTFTDIERFAQLTKNEFIIDTPLYNLITTPDHDLHYTKRGQACWSEIFYDDSQLRNAFFRMSVKQIQSLTAGPFLHRKAGGYKKTQLQLFIERQQWRSQRSLDQTTSTVDSVATPSISYKIEKLSPLLLHKYFPEENLTSLFRFDINSYFAKSHKFKTYIGIKNHPSEPKLTFGCTCSTGTRLTPCVHNILILSLFANNSC